MTGQVSILVLLVNHVTLKISKLLVFDVLDFLLKDTIIRFMSNEIIFPSLLIQNSDIFTDQKFVSAILL